MSIKKNKKTIQSLVKKHILPLEEKVKNADFRYFETFKSEVQDYFQMKVDDANPTDIKSTIEDILSGLKSMDLSVIENNLVSSAIADRAELAATDKRVELLFELIEEVEKIAPFLPYFILNRIRPQNLTEAICKCYGIWKDCQESEGEKAAERLADLFHEVSERLYDNYVRIIYELFKAKQGKKQIKSYQPFGLLINNLKNQLPPKYQPLINFQTSWFRNAIAHKERKYLPKTNSLLLYQSKKRNYEEKTICIPHFIQFIDDIFFISGPHLQQINHIYLTKSFLVEKRVYRAMHEIYQNLDLNNIDEHPIEIFRQNFHKEHKHLKNYQLKRVA